MTDIASSAMDKPWRLDDQIRRIRVQDAEWSYVDTGGNGAAILLLPGSVGTCEVFFKTLAALGGAFRLVAANYPGISDPAKLADGLAGLQKALGLERALIVGSSFSAYWLQHFAARHPESVNKLLLGNGFVEGAPLRAHPLFDPALLSQPADVIQRTWFDRVAAAPASELRELQLDMLRGRQSAEVLRSRLVSVIEAGPAPRSIVPESRIVLLDCDDDPIITPAMRAAFRESHPGAVHRPLQSGGHYPHILNPDGYAAVLCESTKDL